MSTDIPGAGVRFFLCAGLLAPLMMGLQCASPITPLDPNNSFDECPCSLNITVEGEGAVTLSPPTGPYAANTRVTLTAHPGEDWVLDHWEYDSPLPQGHEADNPITITMTSNFNMTAVLKKAAKVFDTLADFQLGTFVGLTPEHSGGLRIASESTTFPFIWVPNSNEGTISKVDTNTGNELGRYRVSPADFRGDPSSDPSRTTVDLQGSCYVANRDSGTVVKVGLLENGGCVDRNGNGTIETSRDLNRDGDITGDELLPWGGDECVLFETILATSDEGAYVPGTYTGTYPNGHWDPGTRSIAVDPGNNVWVGVYGTRQFYYLNGTTGAINKTIDVSSVNHTPYGAVIDRNGILWSSGQERRHVLRLDPATESFTTINMGHFVYGLGIDLHNHVFVSGWHDSKLSRIDVLTHEIEWTHDGVHQSRGVAVTDDGDVWVADSGPSTVTRWSNDGVKKATISVGSSCEPTGVAVDADQKVWVVDNGDEYIRRIDPATNTIDLEKRLIGTRHYGYSDMTGIVARTVSTRIGNWTVTYSGARPEIDWNRLQWNALLPSGTTIKVRVRTSEDQENWSPWFDAANGVELNTLPNGMNLQVEVTLQVLSGDASPTLNYLAVFTQS